MISNILKDLFTEKDGESYCPERVMLVFGVLVFIGLSIYNSYAGKPFDPQNWGIGYGSLLGGGGVGIWSKGKSE